MTSTPHRPSAAAAARASESAETIYATVNRATARRNTPGALPLAFSSLNFYSRPTLDANGSLAFSSANAPSSHPLAALDTPTSHPRRAP